MYGVRSEASKAALGCAVRSTLQGLRLKASRTLN